MYRATSAPPWSSGWLPGMVARWSRSCAYDSTVEAPAVELTDAVAESRYEARVDGELAGILEYIVKHSRIALAHTEVLPAFEGRGIASKLAKFGLDEARRRELGVIVVCPFVRSYLQRHPEELDIVKAGMSG